MSFELITNIITISIASATTEKLLKRFDKRKEANYVRNLTLITLTTMVISAISEIYKNN